MYRTYLLGAFILISLQVDASLCSNTDQEAPVKDNFLNELFDKVISYQVLKEQNYTPPFKWAEKLGLFRSDIRVNLAGNPIVQEIRSGKIAKIFDNDMFSSGWILTVLLEASLYGSGAPKLDESNLKLALEGKLCNCLNSSKKSDFL